MPEHHQEKMPMHGNMGNMHDNAMPHKHMHKMLINTIQGCEAVCEEMTTILKRKPDLYMRANQLRLLRDCADICGLTAKFIARHSMFAHNIAGLCVCICEACGRECARWKDPESQNCARVCLNCAKECRKFASMSQNMM